jgi:phosphatidylserine/phosphatidylglycerophosphate/cardiolipin synthase-like enzyme
MQNAVAFANNDVVTIAWSYDSKPAGCMGFALYRIDDQGTETALPSHAVFKGFTIQTGQTTRDFPLQKFYWKDPYARLVAEKTGNRTFRYRVVPLEGTPGSLTPMQTLSAIVSNAVTVSSEVAPGVRAIFNRGLISTQRVSRAFGGKPAKGPLLTRVADATDPLRASLSGDMVETLTGFVARAATSGTIYAALYELTDAELLKALEGLGAKLQIVLSNAVVTDEKTKTTSDENQPARDALSTTAKVEQNRIMPSNHIGHNKFLVYVDGAGHAKAVLFGSTNWTATGLCTQTNNTMVVEDAKLAGRYLDYWKQLDADTKNAGGDPKKLQGTTLRTWDATGKTLPMSGATSVTSWFSPNTPKPRSSNTANEKRPPDMAALADCIAAAKHAILFLVFYPGTPSIANWTADAVKKDSTLFVRGCVTNKSASGAFYYELKGMTPPKKVKGQKTPIKQDPRVIGAEAFDGNVIPTGWQREILNAGFAIIHDKIVVIDPFWDTCVVATGSHNMGHKASFDNDENLAIVKGNQKLAVAYATHVLDVYDHFAWRYMVKQKGTTGADQSLKSMPDEWLDQYFDASGQIKVAQLKFWLQAKVTP